MYIKQTGRYIGAPKKQWGKWGVHGDKMVVVTMNGQVWVSLSLDLSRHTTILSGLCPNGEGAQVPDGFDLIASWQVFRRVASPDCESVVFEDGLSSEVLVPDSPGVAEEGQPGDILQASGEPVSFEPASTGPDHMGDADGKLKEPAPVGAGSMDGPPDAPHSDAKEAKEP